MKIRGKNVLIPTSMVGAYPNPRWWDAYFARFFNGGRQPPDAFEQEALEDAILALAHDQEQAGLDIISDARVQGDNYADQVAYYYARQLGCDLEGANLGFPIYSRLHAVTLRQPLHRVGSLMVRQARALKRATDKPTKVQYIGMQAMTQLITDLHYGTPKERAQDLAKVVNQDILEIDSLGVDFIQLDEFTWPYFFEEWGIDAFNRAVQGVKNARIVVHVCWGNWGGTPAYLPDDTAKVGEVFELAKRRGEEPKAMRAIIPQAYGANIAVLNVESAGRREGDLSGLAVLKEHPLPDGVDFWGGVIDVKSTITETAEQVAARIRRLIEFVPAERLGVTTDCGLQLLQRYVAQTKLEALVQGARIVRGEIH
jgi:5-methyltetrahydropteroyltriglutamate--homocysteine methyltransferase